MTDIQPLFDKWTPIAKKLLKLDSASFRMKGEIVGAWLAGRCDVSLLNNATSNRVVWGSFSGMPGCCGAAVIHEICSMSNDLPTTKLMYEFILEKLKQEAWTLVTLTTNDRQEAWKFPLLDELGFRQTKTFKNKRTENQVTLWTKTL